MFSSARRKELLRQKGRNDSLMLDIFSMIIFFMLDIIRNEILIMLNMQHMSPNSKRLNYSDTYLVVAFKKKTPTWLRVVTTWEIDPQSLSPWRPIMMTSQFKDIVTHTQK